VTIIHPHLNPLPSRERRINEEQRAKSENFMVQLLRESV
jgi:hypothetical protein